MAGAGVRIFTAGSQLLASQVNTYLMDQVVCYFADSGARTAAFGGAGQPSLSPGRLSYLLSDNKLYLYGNDNQWAEIGAQLDPLEVTTAKIDNEAVTAAKIASAVAGSGLSGGAGTALAVNVDDSTIQINSDTLRVKDSGITSAKLSSSLSFTGSTSIEQVLEKATVVTGALSATTQLNALSGAVYYSTASTTANITLNLRGDGSNSLASLVPYGKAFSCVFMITSGSTSGKILTVTADSSTVSLKWFGGNTSPAGSSGGSVDVYTITAVRTNSDNTDPGTFTIFISQSKFA